MKAKNQRPPSGSGNGGGRMSATKESAPVRGADSPEQAVKDADTAYRTNASFAADSATTAGGRQDKIARYETNGGIFQQVKDAVTVTEAAAFYGYAPNRAGFIRCPFHGGGNEKTPSCHLTERYFKCFACQEGGDVIKFTARLFDVRPLEAVKLLNADCNVGLSLERHAPTPEALQAARKRQEERDAARRFENWRTRAEWALSTAAGVGEAALRDKSPDARTEAESLAVRKMADWDYLRERLCAGDEAERVEILRRWPVIGADVAKAVSVHA